MNNLELLQDTKAPKDFFLENLPNHLSTLPEELIYHIFSMFKYKDLIRISCISRQFYQISSTSSLWTSFLNCTFLKSITEKVNHKKVFIDQFNLAKKLAQENGKKSSKNVQSFGISDQFTLIELAKLASQKKGIFKYIQNYKITDQKVLIGMAKLAAQSFNFSKYVQNYGITDPLALIEIAKLAAQKYGGNTSYYIRKYGITDQQALIEIAKLAVKQDPYRASPCIKRYGITDERALEEIAKLGEIARKEH